jgi:hypothetical protein
MRKKRNMCRILVGKSERKKHLEDLVVDGWMVIKCILWKYGRMLSAFVLLRIGARKLTSQGHTSSWPHA